MKSNLPAFYIIFLITILSSILFFTNCKNATQQQNQSDVYPMYVDTNNNGINDYYEEFTHNTSQPKVVSTAQIGHMAQGPASYNHPFTDLNGDGICDYAQNGSNTWHGPGFLDNDEDGYCDYWESNSSMQNRQGGMWFKDENHNQINDYFEQAWHDGHGHPFVDTNGDGICDYAQNGSDTWHGPGFIDENNDGICDHWENGGRGYGNGNGMHMGGGMMGGN
ncbi:MAG TPA: hypothetical protein VKA34_17655 [Balneolales bacterium]|nr:hypothetical protein [Balneolales bacterium]